MKKNALILLFAITAFGSSCTTYLHPAMKGNDLSYQPRPLSADSIRNSITIMGNIASASGIGAPAVEMGILNIGAAKTYNALNYAFTAFGFAGVADHNGTDSDRSQPDRNYLPSFDKSFYGFGLKTSIGYHETSRGGKADFRLINWENSISNEYGTYSHLRSNLHSRPTDYYRVYSSNRRVLWTTGLSTEIIFKYRKQSNFRNSFRVLIAGSPRLGKSYNREITGYSNSDAHLNHDSGGLHFSYYMQYHGLSFGGEIGGDNLSGKIGLGYSF